MLTEKQKKVWAYCAQALGRGDHPTLDEIQGYIGLGKAKSDFAVNALVEAKLLRRDHRRYLEFTADGREEAKRRGWVKRTAEEECEQIADYIEHKIGRPTLAEDLRTGDHWTPESRAEIADEKVAQQAARGTDAG